MKIVEMEPNKFIFTLEKRTLLLNVDTVCTPNRGIYKYLSKTFSMPRSKKSLGDITTFCLKLYPTFYAFMVYGSSSPVGEERKEISLNEIHMCLQDLRISMNNKTDMKIYIPEFVFCENRPELWESVLKIIARSLPTCEILRLIEEEKNEGN